MSQFPLVYSEQDSTAAVDAINYLLSGPSGLGQNFSGVSGYNTTFLTGNFRTPFVTATVSVNSLGVSGQSTVTVDSVDGIREGDLVGNASGLIGAGAQVAPGGIDINTRVITLTVPNTGTITGLVTFGQRIRADLYVAPVSITTIQYINPFTIRINFAAQPTPPFELGNTVRVSGNSVTIYDYFYTGAGVIETTTTSILVQSNRRIAVNPGTGTGGTVTFANTLQPPVGSALPPVNDYIQTDCVGAATLTGATDRVFVSGQLNQRVEYVATVPSDLRVSVFINRYRIVNISSAADPALRNVFDGTVAQRQTFYPDLTGSGTLPNAETVFNTFIDQPAPGFYNYRLEMVFRVVNTSGSLQVTRDAIDVRALSVQVVKQ